jgi:molybdopterin synthase sulfur carrier subunit
MTRSDPAPAPATAEPGAPGDAPATPATPGTPVTPATAVTVRYWAAARAAAGVDSERQVGATVGAVVDAAVARHPDLARVARVATFLVDGRKAAREAAVEPGSVVEVLPPFAGG